MGSVKDRNGMALTEVEDIKKRWQEYYTRIYTEEFCIYIVYTIYIYYKIYIILCNICYIVQYIYYCIYYIYTMQYIYRIYTEELYKKDLDDSENHDARITHL